MEKPEISTRDEGGGGGGGGSGVKSGKKTDDDEDLGGSIVQRDSTVDFGLAQFVRHPRQNTGMRLLHLLGRRDRPENQLAPLLQVESSLSRESPPTATYTATPTITIPDTVTINAFSVGSSSRNQVVLSSTPPPSPADSLSTPFFRAASSPSSVPVNPSDGRSFINSSSASTTTGAGGISRSSSFSATAAPSLTTTTSFISRPTVPVQNSTASAGTSWSFSTTTSDGTIIVIASPTPFRTSGFSTVTSSRLPSTPGSTNYTGTSTRATWTQSSSTTILATDSGAGGGPRTTATDGVPTISASPTGTASDSGPVNSVLVGGIMGGLAGFALILVAMLFAIKWHKRNRAIQARDEAACGGPLPPGSRDMSERTAGLFGSGSGPPRDAATEPAARGFYRVPGTGRKLPPVIGGSGAIEEGQPSMEGQQPFFHDDYGTKGPLTPTSSAGPGPSRFSGHTAISISPTIASSTTPFAASPTSPVGGAAAAFPPPAKIQEERDEGDQQDDVPREMTPASLPRPPHDYIMRPQLGGRDGLGRSLPSHDGSRASRFTEDIV